MSRKPAKKQANIIEMPEQNDIDLIAELEQSLEKMKKDQEEKLASGIENFFDMIDITADKYHTVTGAVAVIQDYHLIFDESYLGTFYDDGSRMFTTWDKVMDIGCRVAIEVIKKLENVDKLINGVCEDKSVETLVHVVNGLYQHNFVNNNDCLIDEFLVEMQMIKICQQLGPIADNLVEFKKRTDEEIENTERKLANLKTMHDDAENNVQHIN